MSILPLKLQAVAVTVLALLNGGGDGTATTTRTYPVELVVDLTAGDGIGPIQVDHSTLLAAGAPLLLYVDETQDVYVTEPSDEYHFDALPTLWFALSVSHSGSEQVFRNVDLRFTKPRLSLASTSGGRFEFAYLEAEATSDPVTVPFGLLAPHGRTGQSILIDFSSVAPADMPTRFALEGQVVAEEVSVTVLEHRTSRLEPGKDFIVSAESSLPGVGVAGEAISAPGSLALERIEAPALRETVLGGAVGTVDLFRATHEGIGADKFIELRFPSPSDASTPCLLLLRNGWRVWPLDHEAEELLAYIPSRAVESGERVQTVYFAIAQGSACEERGQKAPE